MKCGRPSVVSLAPTASTMSKSNRSNAYDEKTSSGLRTNRTKYRFGIEFVERSPEIIEIGSLLTDKEDFNHHFYLSPLSLIRAREGFRRKRELTPVFVSLRSS